MIKENKALNIICKFVLAFAMVAVMTGLFSIKSLAVEDYYLSQITSSDLEGISSFQELFASFGNFVPTTPEMLSDIPHPTGNVYWVVVYYSADGERESVYLPNDGIFHPASGPYSYDDFVEWINYPHLYYYVASGDRLPRRPRGNIDFWAGLNTDLSIAGDIAKNTGLPQTVNYKGVGALPKSVIDFLLANPLVTLEYETVDEQGNPIKLLLNADILAYAEKNITWFGVKYIQRMTALYNCAALLNLKYNNSAVYIVQENDTYESIATKFGLSLDSFMSFNALTRANGLRVGQKVIVKY